MTAHFIPPVPNCGHDDVTFTHDINRGLWTCTRCTVSGGRLFQACVRCGRPPTPGTLLIDCYGGHHCSTCQRDLRAARRRTS